MPLSAAWPCAQPSLANATSSGRFSPSTDARRSRRAASGSYGELLEMVRLAFASERVGSLAVARA